MKKGLPILALILLTCTWFVPTSLAADTAYAQTIEEVTTLTDLQENIDYLFPKGSYLSGLESHSIWQEVERKNMVEMGGIEVTYEALLDEAPNFTDELPTINAYLIPAASRAAAEAQFNAWANSLNFTYGTWEKLTEGRDYFSYYTTSLTNNDLVKYRYLEESSLHLVSYYDNTLMVANFYRPAGQYNKTNVSSYLDYLDNYEETISVMNELFVYSEEALKFYLGSVFSVEGPDEYDHYADSASYSTDLSEDVEIPLNGRFSFEMYIDDGSEVGTVLDMNGIDTPLSGAFTVGINENAIVQFSFYDEGANSGCQDESGWHHLYSLEPLDLYEWQTISVAYGYGEGLQLLVNDEAQDTCVLFTSRADTPVYLGDYPGDSIEESFVGYVKGITTEFSEDDDGVLLDSLVGNMIFADVSEAHPYAEAIEYLREEGIIEGYANGTFRPNQYVNRVEILKMLLLGFGYEVPEDFTMPEFIDLDEEAWYLPYLNFSLELDIVEGHANGTYLPSHSLNRAEFLKILLNTYGIILIDYPITELYPDTPINTWYASYVQYSKDNGLMDPDSLGNFNPSNEVTRGEVAETIYRLIQS